MSIHIGSMSQENCIDILERMLNAMKTFDGIDPSPERINAVEMAIDFLKRDVAYGLMYEKPEFCEDCISRKDQDCISRESVELALTGKDLPEDRNEYIALIDKRIRELPSVLSKAKWIPVSESLPEESHNSVLGWDAYRERCVFVQYWDGYFQITGKTESFDIKAWMPLPEPYREVEEWVKLKEIHNLSE